MRRLISDWLTGISELGLDKSAHFLHLASCKAHGLHTKEGYHKNISPNFRKEGNFLKMFGSPLIRYSIKSLKDCAAIYHYVKSSPLSNLDDGDNNFR
jgi:hypothetical protein